MNVFRSAKARPLLATGSVFALVVGLGGLSAVGSTPGTDTRLTQDYPGSGGYVSNYTLNHPTAQVPRDSVLRECSRSRGRQNEPSVAVDPRNTDVVVGSSNDYCGVYNDGDDADGAPIPSGPIWLGYYRSQDAGNSFQSSLVPGYPVTTRRTPRGPSCARPRPATRSWRGTSRVGCSSARRPPTTRTAR